MLNKYLYTLGFLSVNISCGGIHVAIMRHNSARWWHTFTLPLCRSAGILRRRAIRHILGKL